MARGRNAGSDGSEAEEVSKNKDQIEPSGEDEEDDEEYEIEEVINAEHGRFPGGEMGYWVKWKNYDASNNSWVAASDAGNAADLIDEYWRKQPKSKRPTGRKSGVKPSVSSVKKRKSSPSVSDAESAPAPKRRSRTSKAKSVSEEEDEIEEIPPPTAKPEKKRVNAGLSAKSKKKGSPVPMDEDEETYQDMTKWRDAASWAHLVDSIDTVERQDDGELYVYFKLKSQKGSERLCREPSDICKKKMPELLLNFYEQNLRWRAVDDDE